MPASPRPPCAGTPQPAYPEPGEPPAVRLWHMDAMPPGWAPAACSGLERREGAVLVAVAGRFREPGGMEAILERLASISRHVEIVYWSVSNDAWKPLLEDAAALGEADPEARRGDFALDELRPGAVLHLLYDDSEPVGPIVNEVTVVRADPDGVTLLTRNVTPAKLMGFEVAGPGDIASMLTVEREAEDLFRYYALGSTALSGLAGRLMPDASHVNRAVAVYRHVAGIPGDKEPPAATQ